MFVFIAGSLCLDFCNTEIEARGKRVNLLKTNENLVSWAKEAGSPLTDEKLAPNAIEHALQLRTAIKNIIHAQVESVAPNKHNIDIVNAYYLPKQKERQLEYVNGSFMLREKDVDVDTAAFFTQIVQSLMTLLTEEGGLIKKCANPHCVLHFIDKSRTQKRKWCSMEICGNRSKVAIHQRQKNAKTA